MKTWTAYADIKISYCHLNYCKGIKYVKRFDTVNLPPGTIIEEIEFYPEPLTDIPLPLKRKFIMKRFYPAETFPQLWQAGRKHSMETIIGNLEDIDLNPVYYE